MDNVNISISQFVEENELSEENMKNKRKSRRMKCKNKERRHSRISFNKEINLLKNANFSLKWSIHANEFE